MPINELQTFLETKMKSELKLNMKLFENTSSL